MPTKRRPLKHAPRIGEIRVTARLLDPHLQLDGFERTLERLHRQAYPIASSRPPRLQDELLEDIRE